MREGVISLGDITITTAGTQTATAVTGFDGALAANVQMRFAFGGAGTNAKVYLQTSLDEGTSWIDIACAVFTTAALVKVYNFSGLTAKTTPATPTDGTLADDTAVDGILGDRFRVKVVSTGTYTGTILSVRISAR